MKATKNFKALENVLNDCFNMGDTLFAIYGVKGASESKKGGKLVFTGDPKMIADGMAQLIRESLADAVDTAAKRRFGKKMTKKIKERADEPIPVLPDDFDPKSKVCQECEDFADCLVRAFIRQAEKRVRQVEKIITIPTNGKGKARKTKKANKKDEK